MTFLNFLWLIFYQLGCRKYITLFLFFISLNLRINNLEKIPKIFICKRFGLNIEVLLAPKIFIAIFWNAILKIFPNQTLTKLAIKNLWIWFKFFCIISNWFLGWLILKYTWISKKFFCTQEETMVMSDSSFEICL